MTHSRREYTFYGTPRILMDSTLCSPRTGRKNKSKRKTAEKYREVLRVPKYGGTIYNYGANIQETPRLQVFAYFNREERLGFGSNLMDMSGGGRYHAAARGKAHAPMCVLPHERGVR